MQERIIVLRVVLKRVAESPLEQGEKRRSARGGEALPLTASRMLLLEEELREIARDG